ncbi:hypothetical protein [Blastococcus saxobsidens]|uniref:Uncharacterized protein n=1 Tax=Blastococcus saxobsidens (strain DD2) TaxID=1146883 RepID=H6RTB7_BLASD|nr:hypothetical protein [Blastococcus saxobsidens]CCG05617.1 conserved protein of unknown function, putative tubulin domain [Blastococcus saxobsidens DD2]
MRPLTHDDPDAIPRNGTDAPWPEIPAVTAGGTGSGDATPASEESRDGQDSPGTAAQPAT